MPRNAITHFTLAGTPVACEPHGHGHVNTTYQVVTDRGAKYILQQLNRTAFTDIPALMENVAAVTAFLCRHTSDPRAAMRLVPTSDGKSYYEDEAGRCWRVCSFIPNSICLERAETPEDLYESALAFGRFQQLMACFPAEKLHETIPDFHNTIDRYAKLKEALAADVMGRAASVEPELTFLLEREEEMGTLHRMRLSGELPLRVTHNDTKLNNVMMDAATRRSLCVIDLDTVMPGLAAYDYGDAIRFGAATAAEDEKDLTRMTIDLELYRAFTRGFLAACPGLTPKEVEMLPMGAKTMTMECGVRFLTDYLKGDEYFSIAYPDHNLDRCRTQIRLAAEMEQKWDDMQRILKEESER